MKILMLDVLKDVEGDILVDIRFDDGHAIGISILEKEYSGWVFSKNEEQQPIQEFELKPVRQLDFEF